MIQDDLLGYLGLICYKVLRYRGGGVNGSGIVAQFEPGLMVQFESGLMECKVALFILWMLKPESILSKEL